VAYIELKPPKEHAEYSNGIPIVLCELEGMTHKEAASQLGWPIGTVSSRLSRARSMLAKRMARRGVSLSVGSLATLLAQESASARIPTNLIGSTARAASLIAAGGAVTAGVVSAEVAALTVEVLKIMVLSKIKVVTAMLLVVCALAAGGTSLAYRAKATEPTGQKDDLQRSIDEKEEVLRRLNDEQKGEVQPEKGQREKTRPRASRPPGQFDLSAEDFSGVKTLKDAVEVVKQELFREGKAEYVSLLSEQRVRDAMQTGIRAYEAYLDKSEKVNPGSKEHFIGAAKPVFMKIIEDGTWPPNCSFFGFFTLTSAVGGGSVNYDGFWLRLKVDTPKERFGGFALPIMDMAYGKIEF
jgi:hypothetical protein